MDYCSRCVSSRFLVSLEAHSINPLNTELNPICHRLALLGAHHILHISRIRVNPQLCLFIAVICTSKQLFTLHFKLSLTAHSVCRFFSLHSTVFHFRNYKRNCDSMNLCCKQIQTWQQNLSPYQEYLLGEDKFFLQFTSVCFVYIRLLPCALLGQNIAKP